MLNNCLLIGNSATNNGETSAMGGGAYGCTLNNCTLSSNSASWGGGGAGTSTLNNCLLIGNLVTVNAATVGGGILEHDHADARR